MLFEPGVAWTTMPGLSTPQVPLFKPLGVATTNPGGRSSVNSISTDPIGIAKLACVSSKTSVELLPSEIVLGEKAFAIENELPAAVNVAVAVPPIPLLALTLPVVLVYT